MSDRDYFWVAAFLGLAVIVVICWSTGSWSPTARRLFHALWPVVCLTSLLESILFSIDGLPMLFRFWPSISLSFVLAIGYMSRKWKAKTRLRVRAATFGFVFAVMPTPYNFFVPAVLVPFVSWSLPSDVKDTLFMFVDVIGLVALFAATAAGYLLFLDSRRASGLAERVD